MMNTKHINICILKQVKSPFGKAWLGSLLLLLLASCSDIAEDERLIYVEPAKAARNVLIEDFTGQRCVNCPKAAEAIHEIQDLYGENIIAVAIHCGPFGGLSAKNNGLMTESGKDYWKAWFEDTQGQPVAKINRGAATDDYKNWSSLVAESLKQTTDVTIGATVNYTPGVPFLTINATSRANSGRKAKIQAWLTEDDIVALQKMPDGSFNSNYVHQHVFRATVNGPWGEEVVYGEEEQTFSWMTNLDSTWKLENMHVVIFVYDDKGVEQVIQIPVSDN